MTFLDLEEDDEDLPASLISFAKGVSLTDAEASTLRAFPWAAEPTESDHRGLLEILRTNAARAA